VIHHPGKPSVVRAHPECSAGKVIFRRCIAERLFGGDFRFGVEVYQILLGLPNVRTRCSIVADAGWGNHGVLDIELAGGGKDVFGSPSIFTANVSFRQSRRSPLPCNPYFQTY
jgi:hypothetical protein